MRTKQTIMKQRRDNITQRRTNIIRHLTGARKIITFGLVIMLFTFVTMSSAFAESFQSTEQVQFTFNSTISVNITGGDLVIESLTPGDGKDSNIITVTTSSNAAAGYNVYGSVGSDTITNTNLTHTNGSNTFTSINTTTALNNFQDNQWGYAYSTDSGSTWVSGNVGSTSVGYNGLPLYNGTDKTAGVLLASTTTPISSSFQFKIGAKAAGTQVAGNYTNVINFIGITNPDPEPPVYMQDATLADCGKTMYDERDNSDYTTALINGECYMTQNLRITGTISAGLSNFSGNDFNVSQYSLASSDSSYSNHCDSTNGYNYACAKDSGRTDYGVWYNYVAASAGTIKTNNNSTDATSDICPSGWRLPTDSEFSGITSSSSAFSLVYGGYYYNGTLYSASYEGDWWSSTASNVTTRYLLNYDDGDLGTDYDYRYNGSYVRCVRSS